MNTNILNLLNTPSTAGIVWLCLAFIILSVIVGMIMIFAYISTKNAIIDIVSSFETQNSNSYEIRMNVFSRAINFLANIENKGIDENTKRKELGEIFDNLLICSNNQETLSTFEKMIKIYIEEDRRDEALFMKFKGCVRREFGGKKYTSKVVNTYAIPSGRLDIGFYGMKNGTSYTEGSPLKPLTKTQTSVKEAPNQTPGATIITSKTQETKPVITSIFDEKPAQQNNFNQPNRPNQPQNFNGQPNRPNQPQNFNNQPQNRPNPFGPNPNMNNNQNGFNPQQRPFMPNGVNNNNNTPNPNINKPMEQKTPNNLGERVTPNNTPNNVNTENTNKDENSQPKMPDNILMQKTDNNKKDEDK